jgi:hypothetical protein
MRHVENESVKISHAITTRGGIVNHVVMDISEGKLLTIKHALEKHDSIIAHDMLKMIWRAENQT